MKSESSWAVSKTLGSKFPVPSCRFLQGFFDSYNVNNTIQVKNAPKYLGTTENYLCIHRVCKAPRWSRAGYDVSLFKRIKRKFDHKTQDDTILALKTSLWGLLSYHRWIKYVIKYVIRVKNDCINVWCRCRSATFMICSSTFPNFWQVLTFDDLWHWMTLESISLLRMKKRKTHISSPGSLPLPWRLLRRIRYIINARPSSNAELAATVTRRDGAIFYRLQCRKFRHIKIKTCLHNYMSYVSR